MTITTKKMPAKRDAAPKPDRQRDSSGWQSSQWRPLDTALWCYLFLPVVIFLPGFFIPSIGVPATLMALAAAVYWLPGRLKLAFEWPHAHRDAIVSFCMVAIFAAVWVMLGGAGHVFHANPFDWVPRFAVLRDLVVQDWPPRYVDDSGRHLILRAPIGYYLPPAWLARNFDLAWADTILLVWTWTGVALFFTANLGGTVGRKIAGAALFTFASGLDIVGVWLAGGLPWLGGHLEWWAGRIQYSSNTTLLFWVPNHALPGWIAAAWLWRFRDDPRFVARLPILFLPVMLWSPLSAIGLLPLAVVAAWLQWYRGSAEWAGLFRSLVLVAPAAGLIAAYLLVGAGAIDAGVSTALQGQSASDVGIDIWKTLIFFVLEAGLFGMLALRRNNSPLVLASLIVLAVLPWFRFGPNNDLAMRGSIPALTILWIVLIAELTARPAQRVLSGLMRGVLVMLWLLGMVTPFQEIYRALTRKPWAADTTLSLPVALRGFASHYFVSSTNRIEPILNPTKPEPTSKMNLKKSL